MSSKQIVSQQTFENEAPLTFFRGFALDPNARFLFSVHLLHNMTRVRYSSSNLVADYTSNVTHTIEHQLPII